MNREEIIAFLRKHNIWEQTSDGPVSMMLSQNGKPVPLTVTREGDQVIVTTGRFFRRRVRIPLAKLKE